MYGNNEAIRLARYIWAWHFNKIVFGRAMWEYYPWPWHNHDMTMTGRYMKVIYYVTVRDIVTKVWCLFRMESHIYWSFSTNLRRCRFVRIYWSFSINLPRRRYVRIHWSFSTNLRRRRFAEICWSFSTNLRRRCDVTDLSKFIGHFRPIYDDTATSEIRRNLFVILTNLRRCRFVKIRRRWMTKIRRCSDVVCPLGN